MNLWFAKGAVIFCFLAYCVIRAPHGNRSKTVPITENRLGKLDAWLLLGAFLGTTLVPLVWAASGFPSATDYPLHPALYAVGIALMIAVEQTAGGGSSGQLRADDPLRRGQVEPALFGLRPGVARPGGAPGAGAARRGRGERAGVDRHRRGG